MSVEELERWRTSGRDFVLLDVREPSELKAASIPGALHIPMQQLPQRLAELDPQREVAVLCHHGGRSEYAVKFLQAQGFTNAHNIEGGIDAYARCIDASVGLY